MSRHALGMFVLGMSLLGGASYSQTGSAQTQSKTLDLVVADLLRAGSVPGGLEVVRGCETLKPKLFDVTGALRPTLLNLSHTEPSLSWREIGRTYLVTINLSESAKLTSVHLPALQLSIRTLDEGADILLQQQPVRDRIEKLRLSESPTNIGFASINERELREISLPEGTLGEDLNALAGTFGSAIWQLDQKMCDESRSYRLTWIAK